MATTRINGIRYNLSTLTEHELNALLDMAAGRIAAANCDIEKLREEQNKRRQRMLELGLT